MPTDPIALICLGIAAVLVGFAKTGIPGLSIVLVVLLANAFPDQTKQSVGVLLPMLIVGDICALLRYRHHAQWGKLVGLVPAVVLGMGAAWAVLGRIPEHLFRPALGGLVLCLIVLEVCRQRFGWNNLPHHWAFRSGTGFGAGFATTMGNAAGPIMSVYLISQGLPKKQFIGTAAWFFFLVNCSKLPIFWHLHMITLDSLKLDALFAPLIVIGALLGIRLLPHIPQKLFDRLVLILSTLAALKLIV